jgi:hypothetical protein
MSDKSPGHQQDLRVVYPYVQVECQTLPHHSHSFLTWESSQLLRPINTHLTFQNVLHAIEKEGFVGFSVSAGNGTVELTA